MSEPITGSSNAPSTDADILADVSNLLQDCACLHYALTELEGDPQKKAAAARSGAYFTVLCAQLRAYSVRLGLVSSIRDAERSAPSHRVAALKALACADKANAHHHIALFDAEALRLIGQRCCVAGLSVDTRGMLLMVHRILRQAAPSGSLAKGSARRAP